MTVINKREMKLVRFKDLSVGDVYEDDVKNVGIKTSNADRDGNCITLHNKTWLEVYERPDAVCTPLKATLDIE
jgi:hypothetical protein